MSTEKKRTLIAAVRRVAFAGIILFATWFILIALRRPFNPIVRLSSPYVFPSPSYRYNLAGWAKWTNYVWTKSIFNGASVSTTIWQNLGVTLVMIALISVMSIMIAGMLLFVGVFINRVIKSSTWWAKARGILRLVLVSAGAGIPVFVISAFIAVFILKHESIPKHQIPFFWSAFFCSLMPSWLLVQAGYGILSNRAEKTISLHLVQQISIRLSIRVLKLVGLIIVTTVMAGWFLMQPGLGSLLIERINNRDFPVIFGIIWAFVIIIVGVKLIAELIEIAYVHYARQTALIEPVSEKLIVKNGIPQGWLIFSLGLCALIFLMAVFGPLLAPNGSQIHLLNILQPPYAKHLLGTDELGRDILGRLISGIRTDVLIGLAGAAVVSVIAGGWAILAAYCGRMDNWLGDTLEDIVMLPKDIICAFPWLVLLLLLISMPGNKGVILITLLVGLVILPRTAGIMQEVYHSSLKGNTWLRSVFLSIPAVFAFTTVAMIIYVSALGYLGFGLSPGFIELGSLANSAYMQQVPWLTLLPLVILSLMLIVWVMTGDALFERLGFRSKTVWSKTME
ncbi:MAG: hypothetical protein ABR924_20435 [Terracidiphilus sp.]